MTPSPRALCETPAGMNGASSRTLRFLEDLTPRPWKAASSEIEPWGLFIGAGANALEVVVGSATRQLARSTLLAAWKARRGGRASPVLLVVQHPNGWDLCGATGEAPPVFTRLDHDRVERLCAEALDQPDRHAALRFLSQATPSLETALPGIRNEGLLALHELERGVPARDDWAEAGNKARAVIGKRGNTLLQSLGFTIERIDNLTSLLRSGNRRTALAVLLRDSETPEAGVARFNDLSPISYALNKADDENLEWVVLVQGNRLRLYPSSVDSGIGRRGRTETYVECQSALLSNDSQGYLWLLFSAEALARHGSLAQILDSSERFAGDLATRLRERIYDEVVPALAQGIAVARSPKRSKIARPPTRDDLALTYEMALTVLFRLLFIAYAEDRDLLPYRVNDAYRRRSLKARAVELARFVDEDVPIAAGDSHWQDAVQLWKAVAAGNPEWGVPAYNGGLFTPNAAISSAGAELSSLSLPNECFESALRHLLVIETPEGVPGPVDFRSLGVREFGTIYEGLLESELAYAETDLTLDGKAGYVPTKGSAPPNVPAGEVYLHDRSGTRKSSGSYYTKPFAVEHLLEGALEPALTDHLQRLDRMDDAQAAEAFFDFRVADIAMGSAHFLVAAIDRMEKRMGSYLAKRPLPLLRRELAALRRVAMKALGESADPTLIEDSSLLRRLIARRCIYGVDANGLAAQLARVAIWIHTFVPGLPLSFLDRNLVHGNSLVGVGTVEELQQKFESVSGTLFGASRDDLLGAATKPLRRLANLNDATIEDVAAAREADAEVRDAIETTRNLCDVVAAQPVADDDQFDAFMFEEWDRRVAELAKLAVHAREIELRGLQPLHFPVAFPEVFLRERSGFDVVIGNPPWQEATIEEHAFWGRYSPGLRALSQREQEREKAQLRKERVDLLQAYAEEVAETQRLRRILVGGGFPGMGTGDPDLYKAFCWRFWRLTTAQDGRIGVVLPRSAMAAKGSSEFRRTVFHEADPVDITMLLNRAGWVFDDAEHRYTICLVCVRHRLPRDRSIYVRGPYATESQYGEGVVRETRAFYHAEVGDWNDTASLPLLPNPDSVEVFAQLRKAPRLDVDSEGQWRARPDTELHATNQKGLMDLSNEECPPGYWPVYKGESFDLWQPDTRTYYAWADPKPALAWIQSKRTRANKRRGNSPHREFSRAHVRNPQTLPAHSPRIAFRDTTNRTNQRTVIACLVPPRVFIGNQAPYLLWPRGEATDQAFLLGILSSLLLDWYARRFVETHVNYFVFNPLPVPRPNVQDPKRERAIALAGRLAAPDDRFADWAADVGVECGPLPRDEKEDMIHELDAVVAHLYGLTEPQLAHIFETFHDGWDYQARFDGVSKHFRAWSNRR